MKMHKPSSDKEFEEKMKKIADRVFQKWKQNFDEIYPQIKDLPLAPKPKMKKQKKTKRFVEEDMEV